MFLHDQKNNLTIIQFRKHQVIEEEETLKNSFI